MMLEIVFIQCLILFLGHPLTAAATVLCTLLFSSGLGSLYSEKIRPRSSVLRFIAGLTILLILVYGVFLVRSGQLISFIGPELRILAVAIAIAPLGFIMGMLFPLGLRSLHKRAPAHIPWAWGINGCLSVIGPPLATLVAVQYGFQAVFILAASAYFLAFCSITK
jgi:predicted membrane-bound spermidine synthase